MDNNTDVKILHNLRLGNQKAFEVVFRKHNAKIYHFVLSLLHDRSLAEDITQNVFMSIWEHKKDIDPEKNIQAYLYTIAKNMVFREMEKMILSSRYEDHVKTHIIEEDFLVEESIYANSLKEMILRLIEKFPEARKEIFLLHFTEDLSNKEIAKKLSISEENVAQQIQRSLHYIRKHLKNYLILLAFLIQQ